MIDTVLYIAVTVALIGLSILLTWDYWRSKTGQVTISDKAKEISLANLHRVLFWLLLGVVIGFIVGLITGFIMGHLFWPQFVEI